MKNLRIRLAVLLLSTLCFLTAAPAQTFDVLYAFTGTPDGAEPIQSNLLDVNGTFYGTTRFGGTYGFGTIFRLNINGNETVLYSFTGGADGAYPLGGLVRDSKGNLYGTTLDGGNSGSFCTLIGPGCGVVFRRDTAGALTALYSFTGGTDGANPEGVLIDTAGNLYGTTIGGGTSSYGVVYKVDNGGNETVLYTFKGGADGGTPNGLTMDSADNIYGTTSSGGDPSDCPGFGGCEVIFKLDTSGNETVLYSFTGGADGAQAGNLLMDAKGNLYGTTYFGGDLSCTGVIGFLPGCGVVFELTTAGKEKVLHTFKGPDGASPVCGLVRGAEGSLYSTTVYGGASNMGTVFEVTITGREKVLHSFTGAEDGGLPYSDLVMDGKGNLYSNTFTGGDLTCNPPSGCGTVFRLFP